MRWHNFIERCPQHNLLALRALFATILAITITELFALPRNYWSILAIISVSTSIHSKEIIFRSKAIIINTITGCLLGTLLFYYLNLYVPFPVIISITLMLALLNLYFAVVNYPVGVFFNSLFIVMFVGILSSWDFSLFIARVFDIIIGAICILFASFLLNSRAPKERVYQAVDDLYLAHKKYINAINTDMDSTQNPTLSGQITVLENMQKNITDSFLNTEIEFSKAKRQHLVKTLSMTEELTLLYRNYLAVLKNSTDDSNHQLQDFCRQKITMVFEVLQKRHLDCK